VSFFQIDQANCQDQLKFLYNLWENYVKNMDLSLNIYDSYTNTSE